MSPEQARGDLAATDTRTDIYALGAILHELLTGLTPLQAARLHRPELHLTRCLPPEVALPALAVTFQSLQNERRAGLASARGLACAQLTRLLHGELDWITRRALEPERERRYASVEALASDLENWLAGLPVKAAPPSSLYRLAKMVRRHWLLLLLGFSLLLWAGVAAVISAFMAHRAEQAGQRAEKRPSRDSRPW